MRRLVRLVLILALVAGAAWSAANWQRFTLFFFDPGRVDPAAVGLANLRDVTRDGVVLWVADPAPGKPVIFYLPGNAGNLANRAGRFRAFMARGYGLVALGYPGSSGSTGKVTAANIERVVAEMYHALPDIVGKGPVVLYGESIGTGFAVLLNASVATDPAKEAQSPAAILLEAPYTSVRALGHVHYAMLGPLIDLIPEPIPSLDRAPQIKIPLLVLHGTKDRVVPISMGREIFAASQTADKRMIEVAGAGHVNVWQPDAQRALFGFLDRF